LAAGPSLHATSRRSPVYAIDLQPLAGGSLRSLDQHQLNVADNDDRRLRGSGFLRSEEGGLLGVGPAPTDAKPQSVVVVRQARIDVLHAQNRTATEDRRIGVSTSAETSRDRRKTLPRSRARREAQISASDWMSSASLHHSRGLEPPARALGCIHCAETRATLRSIQRGRVDAYLTTLDGSRVSCPSTLVRGRALAGSVEIPGALTSAIKENAVVLFLGAGASIGASHPNSLAVPSSDKLRDLLSDRFLGGKLKNRPLKVVADLCASERDRNVVQSYIREILLQFGPAGFHRQIPEIPWRGIATTNYDLIVERAYSEEAKRCQQLVKIVSDDQQIDTELRRFPNSVPFLKLHGCIDHIENPSIPLILCTESYVSFGERRRRLYERFKDWGYEYTFVFCGYSISDPHIQSILFDLFDLGIRRPRYYVVQPNMDEVESRYWLNNKITAISATLEGFLRSLRAALPPLVGPLAALSKRPGLASISSHYGVGRPAESPELLGFLEHDVLHIRSGMPIEGKAPAEFYRGNDGGWGPIEANLDVPRALSDNVLADAVLIDEGDHHPTTDMFVIKGPAGNGKSVTLKRIAWHAAIDFNRLVLFHREGGSLRPSSFMEIYELTNQRCFLFVDSASRYVDELINLLKFCDAQKIPLTVVTAARDNEWNVRCEVLEDRVVREYPLRNLSEVEIRRLLDLLGRHNALGLLKELTPEQRVRAFLVRAERQLLVALHEATLGRTFEEIVIDEYDRVIPQRARLLYLDVCTLNRLGVGVRAGLISRVSGIDLSDFRAEFLNPLQFVVRAYEDVYSGDYLYAARHSHVAEIVFANVLKDEEERYQQVVRMIHGMNLAYATDFDAFRQLLRAEAVEQSFASYELGRRIYEVALQKTGDDSYVLQHLGIFERKHPSGSLVMSERATMRAYELAPHNKSIRNSVAVLRRRQANDASNPLERAEFRRRAKRDLQGLISGGGGMPQDYAALAEVELDELRDSLLQDVERSDRELLVAVEAVERAVSAGLSRFPGHEFFLVIEARYLSLLKENDRAAGSLRAAFDANPRNEWVAARYSRYLMSNNRTDDAKSVLLGCLEARPDARLAHFELARLYSRVGNEAEKSLVRDHLRRSFSDGDANLERQLFYARQLFIEGNFSESKKWFDTLRAENLSSEVRNKIRGRIRDADGSLRRFSGRLSKKEEAYCFITCDAFKDDIYAHVSVTAEVDWGQLRVSGRVCFNIGFNFRGACGIGLEMMGD
jgi:hypothetical protein